MKKVITIVWTIGIFFLLNGINQTLPAQVLEQDSLALVALYDSTDGTNWTNNTNWLSGPVSTWHGITLFENRVKSIHLIWNNLTGSLPLEIGNLTNLQNLTLYGNKLSGAIPREIGNLINLLSINITQNQLSGTIPAEIGNLINLEGLALYYNKLTGTIPPEIGNLSNLTYLNFHSNRLEGPIPPEIGNLTALTSLSLFWNQLSGPIPVEIWDMTQLTTLRLHGNQLIGSVPSQIGNLTQLSELKLHQNAFEGSIPSEIGNLVSLTELNLADNQFSGTIPQEIFNLTNLIELYLYTNQLIGTLPAELGNLINLTHLQMDGNQFYGSIPPEIGNLTQLEWLYLSNNQLSDSIPSQLGNLKNLQRLYLSGNQLVGSIPEGIGNLPMLEKLILNVNQFTDLPDLSLDTSLVDLQIEYNKFTFEDIEPNLFVSEFTYSPQDSVGEEQDTTIDLSSQLVLSVTVGGTANEYQWKKDNVDIPGANSTSFTIDAAEAADQGSYICLITNTIATDLTLFCRPIHVAVTGEVGITESHDQIPAVFKMFQNYPNPFNPQTTISYQLPKSGMVNIAVYNAAGQLVETLVNERKSAGYFSIDWKTPGNCISSGIYLCRIQTGGFRQSIKLILMK